MAVVGHVGIPRQPQVPLIQLTDRYGTSFVVNIALPALGFVPWIRHCGSRVLLRKPVVTSVISITATGVALGSGLTSTLS